MTIPPKPLVDKEFLLQKFPGKGGWTYAAIPEILQNKNNPFGWVQVKGRIDNFELKRYKLMPMGNGQLFLPVNAAIRRKIGKAEGDLVHITLFADHSFKALPAELFACFNNEPPALLSTFKSFKQGEQQAYLDWIYNAKTEQAKADRIILMMKKLEQKKRLLD